MSTYRRIVSLLADGKPHAENELREVTTFPEHWVAELRKEGHEVREGTDGLTVRLTNVAVVDRPRGLRRVLD